MILNNKLKRQIAQIWDKEPEVQAKKQYLWAHYHTSRVDFLSSLKKQQAERKQKLLEEHVLTPRQLKVFQKIQARQYSKEVAKYDSQFAGKSLWEQV